MNATNKLHHNVYVIELNRDILSEPKFINENPNLDPSLACYYVGITGLIPEERFSNHKTGIKSRRIAKKYGTRLVPELYENYNPMTYELARSMEIILAVNLRLGGHGVW
jgi:hypothetical protein